MAIPPIGAAGITPISPPATGGTQGPSQVKGPSFAEGLDAVQQMQNQADQAASQLATGQLQDVHEFMAASAKASLAVELTVAIRNRAVEAYQEIMRMQV